MPCEAQKIRAKQIKLKIGQWKPAAGRLKPVRTVEMPCEAQKTRAKQIKLKKN